MFVLVEMVDTVRIPPWQFERKLNDSIAEELNKKLANKVLGPAGWQAGLEHGKGQHCVPARRRPGRAKSWRLGKELNVSELGFFTCAWDELILCLFIFAFLFFSFFKSSSPHLPFLFSLPSPVDFLSLFFYSPFFSFTFSSFTK